MIGLARAAAGAAAAMVAFSSPASAEPPRLYDYEIVNEYPHDPQSFTQGLFFLDGHLYESAGQYGESSLRKVALETGEVLQRHDLPETVFGEGAAPWNGDIVALTWKNGVGFVFNGESFEQERTFAYEGEGWGLTQDGERLIMSDGTADLRFLDPQTLKETGRITVTYGGKTLGALNELEWIDGEVFANIWGAEIIARINPETGAVAGLIDMRGLRARLGPGAAGVDVLNGIAYDAKTERLFVTGKYWPKLFEIRLVERKPQ
ncbi:MAG: glutaminyl-peptide cyclotransferase [Amphiplicatus sp.]